MSAAAIATFRIPSSIGTTSPGAINKAIGAEITLAFSVDQSFTALLLECQDCSASIGSFYAYSTKYGARSKLPSDISLHNQMTSRKCQQHFQARCQHGTVTGQAKNSRKRPAATTGSASDVIEIIDDDRSSTHSVNDAALITSLDESDSQSEAQHPAQFSSPVLQLSPATESESLSEPNVTPLGLQLEPAAKKQRCTSAAPVTSPAEPSQRLNQNSDSGVTTAANPSDVEPSLPFKPTAFERDAIPALLQVTRQETLAACTKYKLEVLELDRAGTEVLCTNILASWVTTSSTFMRWCSQHKKRHTYEAADEFMKECRQKKTTRHNRVLRIIFELLRVHHRQTCFTPDMFHLPNWAGANVFHW